MMQRSKAVAIVLLLMVFLAGGAAGWLLHDRTAPKGRRGGRSAERLVSRLAQELDLDATQRDSVKAVLERRHAQTRVLWEGVRPEMDRIRDETQREIDGFLTPEQVARHQRMIEDEAGRRHGPDSLREGAR